jgi:DNA-binding beta-propeller fold protein YncE
VSFDRSGKFLYVANGDYPWYGGAGSNNISAYSFDPAAGTLQPLTGSPFSTGKAPQAIAAVQP